MRRSGLLLIVLGLFAAGAAPPSGPQPPPDDLEQNRRLLDKWRNDPEHFQRLLRDLRAFWDLPAEGRERLRRLDRELHTKDATTQKRLWGVMERYSAWLEQLPEADRQRVLAAANPAERLRVIKEIRERQWLQQLPRKVREGLEKVPPQERAKETARLKQEERLHRRQWQRVPRPPARLGDFSPRVQAFVNEKLLPRLSPTEKERLDKAQGRWPQYAHTLVVLAEKHPVLPALPPPYAAPTHYRDLPLEVRQKLPVAQLRARKLWGKLQKVDGQWPEFPLAVVAAYKELHNGAAPPPLGASRPGEFPAAVKGFIEKGLRKFKDDAQHLRAAEGKWPDYPELLLKLARKHHLTVPGMTLPGPPELWDGVRAGP
jgi:hypothetical protein